MSTDFQNPRASARGAVNVRRMIGYCHQNDGINSGDSHRIHFLVSY